MTAMRDIAHEQIAASTDAELRARLAVLERQWWIPLDLLRELQGIRSELFCRARSLESKPWVTYCVSAQEWAEVRP
jgi:hypothetical protein